MKYRRSYLDDQARSLMCMSSVKVYECFDGDTEKDHYFGIVWRDKQRWSVPFPWEQNKHVLRDVGFSLRYKESMDEQFEKIMSQSEQDKLAAERDTESDKEQMVRDSVRTAVDKPLYFYNK
jgi:hypothetical protein